MYLLTPGQAFVVGTIFLIIFLFKAIGIGLGNAAGKYHVCPRAFEYGYPEPYCQAMIDRQMRFYLGEWIPLYDVNDKESEELKAKLLEKDIKLNEQGKWMLTGKTLEEVERKIYKL